MPVGTLPITKMHRRKIPKNDLGRDFVCGDLHGAYDRLVAFMTHVNFDKSKDRMFSVGDLVDRGPDNEACLSLLREPWFFAVQGNHEQLMWDYYNGGNYGMYWAPNGGVWGHHYTDATPEGAEIRTLADMANDLPVMLTVERQDGKFFHVIHAELRADGPITDADLDDPVKFRELCFSKSRDGDFVVWGRYLFSMSAYKKLREDELFANAIRGNLIQYGAAKMFNENLSHIYSGHTIQGQATRIIGQTNIDTCAYGSYPRATGEARPECGLTVTEPLTDKFWLSNHYGVEEVQPYVLL